MMTRLLWIAWAALVALGIAYAAPRGVISQAVEVCDPNSPSNCIAPNANGAVPVTGSLAFSGTGANNEDAVAAVATGLAQTTSYPFLYNGATFDRWRGDTTAGAWVQLKAAIPAGTALIGKVGIDQTTPGTTNLVSFSLTPTIAAGNGVVAAPSTEALAALAPSTAVAAAESCRVLKASAGNLYRVTVATAATTGYVMIFNATSAPGDGAVSPAWPAVRVVSDGTSGWYDQGFNPPLRLGTGATVCFSSTGPFSKTASTTAAIGGQVN